MGIPDVPRGIVKAGPYSGTEKSNDRILPEYRYFFPFALSYPHWLQE
jgi:hypothetical protein